MDGSGRITKRNRKFLKQIFPFKRAITHTNTDPQTSSSNMQFSNQYHSGPTADKAGRPTSSAVQDTTAAAKSAASQLPAPDTEVRMSDADINAGLNQSVQKVR